MMDFRPYAGQTIIVGETEGAFLSKKPLDARKLYFLGVLAGDLPAHVKAIIADDADDAPEILWAARVALDGGSASLHPLVVFDEHHHLRYGAELLTAIKEANIPAEACVIRGVRLDA
jgi:hypothetical protein